MVVKKCDISAIPKYKESIIAYVYILRQGGDNIFKIGRTSGLIEDRIKQLSTGNAKPLALFDYIESDYAHIVEHYLHKKLITFQQKQSLYAKEFYQIDPEALQRELQKAKIFLDDYLLIYQESEAYREMTPVDEAKDADETIQKVYDDLVKIRGDIEILSYEKKRLENQLKVFIKDANEIKGVASWKMQNRKSLDTVQLKKEFPDIYEKCLEITQNRVFKLL